MRRLFLFVWILPLVCQAKSEISSVTLPIKEYLDLKKKTELSPITAIEQVRLSGSFGKKLRVALSGRCMGPCPSQEVLQLKKTMSLEGCQGNALLESRQGTISAHPLKEKFQITCQVNLASWNEFEMQVLNTLSFVGNVKGADVIVESGAHNKKKVSLVPTQTRMVRRESEITASAKYRLTIEPEETRFIYTFHINNPNRGKRSFEIPWKNGEVMQKVRGLANYEEAEKSLKLKLNPGETTVTLRGKYSGASFKPLVSSEQQYLLIESHPTIQLSVEANARRISPKDPELKPRFTTARLYYFGEKGGLSWTGKKLDVLEAMGYSVSDANYLYYVPESGAPVVEARFGVENQGTPEITFDVPGTPTYVEVNNEPQVLYKGPKGQLLVQVPNGNSRIYLQYRSDNKAGRFIASHRQRLVKPNAVLSNVNVSLLTPKKWTVVFGQSLFGSGSDFDTFSVIGAIFLGLLCFGMATLWGFGQRTKVLLTLGGMGAAFISSEALLYFGLFSVGLTVYRFRLQLLGLFQGKPAKVILATLIAVPVAGFFLLALVSSVTSSFKRAEREVVSQSYQTEKKAKRVASMDAGAPVGELSDEVHEEGGGGFQGLPAKIAIPYQVSRTNFRQSLVDTNGRVHLTAILLSSAVNDGIFMLFGLLMLVAVGVQRKRILAWAVRT